MLAKMCGSCERTLGNHMKTRMIADGGESTLKEPEFYRGRRLSPVWTNVLETGGPEAAWKTPLSQPKAGIRPSKSVSIQERK